MNPAKTELLWAGSKHNISVLRGHAPALQLGSDTVTQATMYECSESQSRRTWASRSMSSRLALPASTGFANFVVSESHLTMNQRQRSYTFSWLHASTTAMHSMQGRRRRSLISCNESLMRPPVSSVARGSSTVACRQYFTVSSIGLTCQRGSPISWPSWCTTACMVRHLGTSPTISLQPLTSLPGFVSVLRTDSNFSYLAVDLTRTAVGLSSLLVRWCGIRYLTNSETRRVVQTVLNSSLRQSCSVFTNVTSTLEVSLNDMRYINSRFTYFTYLLTQSTITHYTTISAETNEMECGLTFMQDGIGWFVASKRFFWQMLMTFSQTLQFRKSVRTVISVTSLKREILATCLTGDINLRSRWKMAPQNV